MKTLALLIAMLPLSLLAEKEDVSAYKVTQVTWGEPVKGVPASEIKPAELTGKVVIVEEFGVLTPACLQRLKELGRLRKKLDRDKSDAVIIAIHRQRQVSDEDIANAVKDERAEGVIIRKNGFLPASIGSMPHAAVFLPDGSMLWHGDSTERDFDRKVDEALATDAKDGP
ncbi:hypothetical protein HAHE_36070 [Haloferula helveola]|uniref:Thioredoxin domain-containing protein n=1 Tax=Haloferula helveola TaxID=490095 RepID=A0ABM7RDE7_9BACT|nr:hypothetical protein HAHE_36070 [Haloferula helveola]